MTRPETKQYTHHFTVTIGFVTRSFDGNWTSLSMEARREIVRELLSDWAKRLTDWKQKS